MSTNVVSTLLPSFFGKRKIMRRYSKSPKWRHRGTFTDYEFQRGDIRKKIKMNFWIVGTKQCIPSFKRVKIWKRTAVIFSSHPKL